MKDEKQIEEMVANIDAYIEGVDVRHWYSDELDERLAEALYNAGYRKASDVAREIIETLESGMEEPITEWHKGYFAALSDVVSMLKKKYTEEEK